MNDAQKARLPYQVAAIRERLIEQQARRVRAAYLADILFALAWGFLFLSLALTPGAFLIPVLRGGALVSAFAGVVLVWRQK